jgi:nicotinate-nucleotide pyrophosphorylase (carboxylating)
MKLNKLLVEEKLKQFLEEDCHFKDVSSEFISEDSIVSARIIAKSKGYISGVEVIKILFEMLDVNTEIKKKDGKKIKKGDIIAILKGNARNILLGERIGLNLITLMSSITTTTQKFNKIIKKSEKKVKIACTRKTIPGLRIFEKLAVELGGGDTHRYSLDDMILLKDNHIEYYEGDIQKLLRDVKKKASFSKKIEIELENIDDILIAAKEGVDIIMLDNMSPEEVKKSIDLLNQNQLRERVAVEVSGGITIENISDYLTAEPDIISTSELTLLPTEKVDLSLEFF